MTRRTGGRHAAVALLLAAVAGGGAGGGEGRAVGPAAGEPERGTLGYEARLAEQATREALEIALGEQATREALAIALAGGAGGGDGPAAPADQPEGERGTPGDEAQAALGTPALSGELGRPEPAGEWDLSGFVAGELRIFPKDPAFPGQDDVILSPSIFSEVELVYEWNDGRDRLTFVPFSRWDATDDNRTHADIREANWLRIGEGWDVVVGIDRVFWGVTESRHLVDIINQTDAVEDIDGEDKLGQPMVNTNLLTDFGTLRFYVLPGFRERTFPASDARLSGPLRIDEDAAEFEADLGRADVDYAVRYTHTIGDVDVGLAHFYGTSREPRLRARVEPDGEVVLVPFYDRIHQTSLDLQAVLGSWLWKLEALTRGGQGDRFFAAVGGVEYTLFDVFGTGVDLGLLAEYLYDGREDGASRALSTGIVADDDVFVGARLSLNDVQGTRLLAGAMIDREDRATALTLEAERRIGDRWQIELEGRGFVNVDSMDPLAVVDDDDVIQLRLKRFF